MLAPAVAITMVATVRTYGISLVSAPFFGWVAEKVALLRVSLQLLHCGCDALRLDSVLPSRCKRYPPAGLVILQRLLPTASSGIVSSQLTEGKGRSRSL